MLLSLCLPCINAPYHSAAFCAYAAGMPTYMLSLLLAFAKQKDTGLGSACCLKLLNKQERRRVLILCSISFCMPYNKTSFAWLFLR